MIPAVELMANQNNTRKIVFKIRVRNALTPGSK